MSERMTQMERIESKIDALLKHAGIYWREHVAPAECIGVGDMDGVLRAEAIVDGGARILIVQGIERAREMVTRAESAALMKRGIESGVLLDDGAALLLGDGPLRVSVRVSHSFLVTVDFDRLQAYTTARQMVQSAYCRAAGWEMVPA